MSFFGTVASSCAPLMTTIAFAILKAIGDFDLS